MGSLADALIGEPLYQVKAVYQMNTVNFYYARRLAEAQDMDTDYMALTQSIAHHAEKMRRFAEANKLSSALAKKAESSNHWEVAAITYHQLGIIAQEQRNFATAKAWCKKALAIDEKRGDEHGMAGTYHQLGRIAEGRRDFLQAGNFYLKSIKVDSRVCL